MNSEIYRRVTSRHVRPVHYLFVAAAIIVVTGLFAAFDFKVALKATKYGIVVVCAIVGAYSWLVAYKGYREGEMRTGLGRVTRATQPGRFLALLWLEILLGPVLILMSLLLFAYSGQ